MSTTLFSDLFRIESLDPGKYDHVARIQAQCTTNPEITMLLDINTDLYPVQVGETLTVALANTLNAEGEGSGTRSWRPSKPGETSLADEYQYVMHGTVYKFSEAGGDKLSLHASFGGLLLAFEGNHRSLASLKQEYIYLLIRR